LRSIRHARVPSGWEPARPCPRFDGVRFTVWHTGTTTAPPEGEVFAFAEPRTADSGSGSTAAVSRAFSTAGSRRSSESTASSTTTSKHLHLGQGTLWVGTDRGLSRYRDKTFTNFRVTDGLAGESVRVVLSDQTGEGVFVGPIGGSSTSLTDASRTFPCHRPAREVSVDAIVRDRAGQIWVGTSDGLVRLSRHRRPCTVRPAACPRGARAQRAAGLCGHALVATNKGLDRADSLDGPGPISVPVVAEATSRR